MSGTQRQRTERPVRDGNRERFAQAVQRREGVRIGPRGAKGTRVTSFDLKVEERSIHAGGLCEGWLNVGEVRCPSPLEGNPSRLLACLRFWQDVVNLCLKCCGVVAFQSAAEGAQLL